MNTKNEGRWKKQPSNMHETATVNDMKPNDRHLDIDI